MNELWIAFILLLIAWGVIRRRNKAKPKVYVESFDPIDIGSRVYNAVVKVTFRNDMSKCINTYDLIVTIKLKNGKEVSEKHEHVALKIKPDGGRRTITITLKKESIEIQEVKNVEINDYL